MSAGTDFAHTAHAEDARVVKARTLAGWCWDAGVVSAEPAGWDEVTRRRVARLAGVNPPSSWATWARVVQFLEMKEGWAAAHEGDERARRLGERPEWLPDVAARDAVCEPQVNEASAEPDVAPAEPAGTTETPLPKNISSADAETETAGPAGAARTREELGEDAPDAPCAHSGLRIGSCKSSDLCDCFDYPLSEKQVWLDSPANAVVAGEILPNDTPPGSQGIAEALSRHPAGSRRRSEAQIVAGGGLVPAVLPPRGWSELVAAGQTLGHGRVCGIDRCGKPAIAATMTVYRCAGHPPMPGEWGAGLDWTPNERACAANRCYCGACPTHRLVPASTIVELVPRDAQADRSAARGGAQRARQAARTARSGR